MKKALIAGLALLAVAGSTAVYAQHRMHAPFSRMSAEDRSAFVDARIAAVRAGLRLNAEQEKSWPAVESAVRELAKLRIDRANARMSERDARRSGASTTPADPVARLRERADDMSATAAALKKLVDAADPLYKSLDDAQKRRLMHLAGPMGRALGPDGRMAMREFNWRDRDAMDRSGRPMHFDREGRRGEGRSGEGPMMRGPHGLDERGSGPL